MIIVGFVIRVNVSTSDPFAQEIVPILDRIKYLADYIWQVALAYRPSLVYSNNGIKAAQTGGGFSVLQLLYPPILYTTTYLTGDTRQELDVTIADTTVVQAPFPNALSIIMSNYKAKEEMLRYNFPLAEVQTFLAGYQDTMNM